MYRKTLLLAVAFSAINFLCFSQQFQKTGSTVQATIGNNVVRLQFFTPEVVRICKYPVGSSFEKKSLSVIEDPEEPALFVKQKNGSLLIQTDKITVLLNLNSGALSYADRNGKPLFKEKDNGASFTPYNDAGNKSYTVTQQFILDNDEAIYGLGQHQTGLLNQRNAVYKNMIQDNLDDVVPFFQSTKGYGVFWDNYSPTTFSDQPEETKFSSTVGDGIDYYFMYGGNADNVIADMRHLTGNAPMFPLWTFGYWQSRERYKSQDELVDVVKKYRQLNVPLDGIIQDWQYWGDNYLWNAMDFLNVGYPHPKEMVDKVHDLNAHMIISIWASFGPMTKPYTELKEKNMLLDFQTWPESGSQLAPTRKDYPSGVRPYDVYNPEARDIYWKYANKGLFSIGIDGWWMDSTEPDVVNFKPADLDLKTHLGSFRKVRNAFPLMTVGGVSEHQRKQSQEKRVFILTRSAFAGQQRYGANTWSGDITSSWETLRKQIPTGLNFSLSGLPYWNSDIGGFFMGKYNAKKLSDPDYRELYTRWLEFGTFCPMMRSHGTDAPREIYQFGVKGDKVYDAIEKYIRLRYQFLPYIYSTSWDVTAHRSTMMRALMMDFANDKNTWPINNEYMFGKSILVVPVTSPMYTRMTTGHDENVNMADFSEIKTQTVYLPKGADWYDYWTGEKLFGGQMIARQTPLDIIPLYVKAGAIIPYGPDVQYATEKKWDELEITVYPGADGDFTLYEDENDNYHYEQGKYSEIKFHWNDKAKTLSIADRKGGFNGMLGQRNFNITLIKDNKDGPIHKKVEYSGKSITAKF